jgi:putative membrane protein
MTTRARLTTLAAGLAALVVALGPLDPAAHRRLAAHMVQHLLIATLAPALIALAAPVRLALAVLPSRGRRALARALHTRAARLLARPAVAVGLSSAVLLAVHLTPALDARSVLHDAEHAAMFWTALAAWMAVLGVDPLPFRAGAIGAMAALSAWMLPMIAIGTVYEQRGDVAAGRVMWLGGLAVVVPAALALFARGLWREEVRQRRRERLEAAR